MKFERIKEEFDFYWVARCVETNMMYLCWYDDAQRQVIRRSLQTSSEKEAFAIVDSLEERGITGDPGDALRPKPLRKIDELLEWHRPYAERLASAEAEAFNIKRLKRLLGSRLIASLVEEDFEKFRDTCLAEALNIGTISRTLSTLRSAINRAVRNKRLKRESAPFVPEFANKNYWRSAPPKARIMILAELAKLIDAVHELHMLVLLVWLINTAARPGAILDFTTGQIDLTRDRLTLNPAGRLQTTKFRPCLPLTSTLRPWCEDLPPGYLITWRGHPIKSAKNGFRKASERAGLPGGEAGYSVRHMLGRWMKSRRVPRDQISLWLGHIAPPESIETTLIYSPDEPEYLCDAKMAVEEFVRELNRLTKRDLLLPPWRM